MIHDSPPTHAQALFEKGCYSECLEYIHGLSQNQRNVPIRILEAVCLIETGDLDCAEVCLRDLRITVPDSAEVCIYLGRILTGRGDDEARMAFSEAVRLDPDNRDGLSWYANFLTSQGDHSAAIPVLIRLYTLFQDPLYLQMLIEAYNQSEHFEEAIQAYRNNGSPICCRMPYLYALSQAGRDADILSAIHPGVDTSDEEFILFIRSLSKISPQKTDQIILPRIITVPSVSVIVEYVRLLRTQGRDKEAIGVWSTYLSKETDPNIRTLICPSLCTMGEMDRVGELYHSVLFPEPPEASVSEILEWLKDYYSCINASPEILMRVLTEAEQILHPSYLAFTAYCSEERGDDDEAMVLYQKSFRSDIVYGGLLYAGYLERRGNHREWEKIIAYILKSIKKVKDLEYVALTCFQNISEHHSILCILHGRLLELLPLLSNKGKSVFCQCSGLLASEKLKKGCYEEGITLCLDALAEIPPDEQRVAEYLFSMLMACKMPGLPVSYRKKESRIEIASHARIPVIPGLTPVEETVFQYIRRHRVCTELELRPVCGTRRVTGLMNRLMRKFSAAGWHILMKEGITESGEVYRYAGP